MHEVFSSFNPDKTIDIHIESIASAMLSSKNPEELLKIFLTTVGSYLEVNRVVVYQLIDQWKGKVLVEAISPNYQSIKNQIYSINYFGVDTLNDYPRDRAIALADVSQVSASLSTHEYWQDTNVKALMSSPILLDLSNGEIWGLTSVQQCDRIRVWRSQEADFLFKISKVLGECLQHWQIRLQSSPLDPLDKFRDSEIIDIDQEEFIVTRIELSQNSTDISVEQEFEEMAVSSEFGMDDENEVLDRTKLESRQASINHAINLAMQKLDWQTKPSSFLHLNDLIEIDNHQKFDDVDVESLTLEDVLEKISQNHPQQKIEYLKQRVQDLTESLQQKFDEVETLQNKIQELTESQKKFRQILLELQSDNLSQSIKKPS